MRRIYSVRGSALRGTRFGDGKTAIRAGFGTYYSLLDSLSKLNALPPFNGTPGVLECAAVVRCADYSGNTAAALLWIERGGELHDLFAAGSSAGREDAHSPTMEFSNRAPAEYEYACCAPATWDRSDITT